MPRLTLMDVRARQELDVHRLRTSNARRMRRVAAGLPACVVVDGDCPVHNSREAASPARATASTTSTHAGGLSGCSTQSA